MRIDMPEEVLNARKGTEYFKFKEGKNKIRIVSDMKHMKEYFNNDPKNKPTDKWVCFLVHYEDEKETIKLAKLPWTIANGIQTLLEDPDWSWEGSIMPFVINVNAKNAGTKEVEYNITPSPKRTDLSKEIIEQLANLDIEKTVSKLKEYRDKALLSAKLQDELPVIQQDEEEDDDPNFITKKDIANSQRKSEPSEIFADVSETDDEIPF